MLPCEQIPVFNLNMSISKFEKDSKMIMQPSQQLLQPDAMSCAQRYSDMACMHGLGA